MDLVKESNKKKAEVIIKALNKRNMQGFYCETTEDACNQILSLIEDNSSVSWGGSLTLDQIGIKDRLSSKSLEIINRDLGKTQEEKTALMKKALTCNYFLTSTNAITIDGILVNIDGNANRVAAICFGPDNVIVVAGMNKICADVDSAIKRIKTNACIPNSMRFGLENPCVVTGKCNNCTNTSICAEILITRLSKVPNRIKVILVNENLGF